MIPIGHVLTDGQQVVVFQLQQYVLGVDTTAVALIVRRIRCTHDTFVGAVVQAHRELRAIGAAAQRHSVAELQGVLVLILLEPVGAFPTAVHLVENALRNEACPISSCTVSVEVCLVDELHILLSSYQAWHLVGIRHTYIAVVLNCDSAFLTLLGGNEDDTVCSTSTVDGARGSVLQHFDTLDLAGVHAVQAIVGSTRNDSVDNEEWGRLTDGSHTTDVHLESLAWLSRALCDVHTGSLALQCSQGVRRVHLRNVLTLHRNVGTGDQLLLLNTITDNNHLFQ